jgi:hypothetical protein
VFDDVDIPPMQLGTAQAEAAETVFGPPPVTPAIIPLKRKQSAQDSSSVSKRPRVGHALNGMNDKLDDFTDVFREAMSGKKTGVDSTPSRKTRAMQRAQAVEITLSDKRIVALIDLFQKDVTVADAYLAITRDGVRKKWVEARTCDVQDDDEEDNLFG